MNSFNESEFMDICRRFEAEPRVREITISYPRSSYFNRIKNSVQKDRRGEVVFCVIRPNRKILVVTCKEYPPDIYRVPTGGIGHSEDIVEAVYREVKEELGLCTEISSFAGAVKFRLEYAGDSVMFYSYVFILRETGGRLLLDASDDEISQVREVDLNGLDDVVQKLCSIEGRWKDWGRLRCESSRAVLEYLKSEL